MKKIFFSTILFISFIFISCERSDEGLQQDYNKQLNSSLYGKWDVSAYIEDEFIHGSFPLIIDRSLSLETDSVTLRDSTNYFWNFQMKVAVNYDKETFETQKSICEIDNYGIGIKVFNGKIIDSDSIYFEIQFEDDETPYGHTYQLKGKRMTEEE